MTLVERLAELRLHLDHLREIRPRVQEASDLRADLSLRNDVLHSLLIVCQAVIDAAGELSARAGLPFQDYTEGVRNLERLEFDADVVRELESLPGFRNVLVHEYVNLDLERVMEALDGLAPVEAFAGALAQRLKEEE